MKHLYLILCGLMIAGCAEIGLETGSETAREALQPMMFSASVLEEPEVKAAIRDLDIRWSAGDRIGIYDGVAFREFAIKSGAETTSAVFVGNALPTDSYIAVYPYDENLAVDPEGRITGLRVPEIQTAGECPVIMTARCEDGGNTFSFRNALAYVKVTPEFDCHKIVLEAYGADASDSGRDLCGDVEIAADSAHVIGAPANHVVITGSIKAGRTFYAAVAPRCLNSGFMVIFDASDNGIQYARKSENHTDLLRGHVLNLGAFGKTSTEWTDKGPLAPCVWPNDLPNIIDDRAVYDWKDVTRITAACDRTEKTYSRIIFMSDVDFCGGLLETTVFNRNGHGVEILGNGHKIANYLQACTEMDGTGYAGLFAVKELRSLEFFDLSLYPSMFDVSSGKDIYGGAFIARAFCREQFKFINCHVRGDIKVTCSDDNEAYAGGFCGMFECDGMSSVPSQASLNMNNCLMEGSVVAYSQEDLAYAGGFFGYINAPDMKYWCSISLSRNRANIYATGDDDSFSAFLGSDGISAGGFIGCDRDHLTGADVAVKLHSCVNEGAVTARAKDGDNAYAGGMIGCHDSDGTDSEWEVRPLICNCLNRGNITADGGRNFSADGFAGGMVGYCFNEKTGFSNCVDDGAIFSDDVCAHVSGSDGSYSTACYWTKHSEQPGIKKKGDTDGCFPELSVDVLNTVTDYATWTLSNGHLDLNF